jgi:SAM-dependent methyltransferase
MKAKPRHLGPGYGAQFQDAAIAAVYRKRPPYPPETFDLITELLPLPSRARVLELGAGTGEIAIPLAPRVESIDAVEISEAMLEIARTQPGNEQVRWHRQSAESFPYASVYDLVICAQSLHWLDWQAVFPRITGSLDPNGWLVIVRQSTLADMNWIDELNQIINRYSTNEDYEPYDLIEELESRGLFNLRGKRSTWPVPFSQSVEDYIDSIHARNGFSRDRMAPDAAAAFDAQVRDLLLSHHPDGIIRGRNQAHLHWGKPQPPGS